jgi:deoxyribonuclease-1-like protein
VSARLFGLIAITGLIIGGWYVLKHYQLEGMDHLRLVPRGASELAEDAEAGRHIPVRRSGNTIRIASFNMHVFGPHKADKAHVMEAMARIVRNFDIVAVQDVRSRQQDVLPRFVEVLNATGRQYDYAVGPRVGRGENLAQFAFLFDQSSVELDRHQLYSIDDPDDLLLREPLVGWFRVRGPPTDQAFTFTLVNVHVDAMYAERELNVLDDVYRVVLNDGRGEDDVILLGTLHCHPAQLGDLNHVVGMTAAVPQTPTSTLGDEYLDNLLFCDHVTTEFTGRAGVFDFMREFNLSVQEALEISHHLPVWAEFSVYEGGTIGHMASDASLLRGR